MGSFASQPAPHLTVWRVLFVAGGSAFDGTPERLHASLEDVVRVLHDGAGPYGVRPQELEDDGEQLRRAVDEDGPAVGCLHVSASQRLA